MSNEHIQAMGEATDQGTTHLAESNRCTVDPIGSGDRDGRSFRERRNQRVAGRVTLGVHAREEDTKITRCQNCSSPARCSTGTAPISAAATIPVLAALPVVWRTNHGPARMVMLFPTCEMAFPPSREYSRIRSFAS